MPPIVSIVGKSSSGKTTLLEKLIKELKSRGYRVATVKHAPRESSFDEPGKDSWRHVRAGSEAAVISSSDKLVLIKPLGGEAGFEQIAHLLGEDYDIILAEGFQPGRYPQDRGSPQAGRPPSPQGQEAHRHRHRRTPGGKDPAVLVRGY